MVRGAALPPQAGVALEKHRCLFEERHEILAEQHVVLGDDDVRVALVQKHPVDGPPVVLRFRVQGLGFRV